MPRITISYRRDDSGVISGRIFDRLVARYGREAIFRDIDDIPYGVDFRTHVEQVLGSTDVVIAIVGSTWAGPSASQSRLSNEADPVRVEIETALRQKVPLIPVLVLGAAMPTVTQLPEALRDFAYRNAVQLDAAQDFDVHMARLLRAIDGVLGLAAEAARPLRDEAAGAASQAPRSRYRLAVAASLAVALSVGAAGAYLAMRQPPQPPPATTTPAPKPPPAFPAQPAAASSASQPVSPPAPRENAELLFWQTIATSDRPEFFERYLRKYPNGQFAGLARNRIAALRPPPTALPTPSVPPSEAERVTPEVAAELAKGKQAIKTRNYPAAKVWYQKAAVSGNAEAQYYLGLLWGYYYHEEGISNTLPVNEADEKRWIEKAANQGYPAAEYRMGERYRLAGPEQNEVEALRWYRKAAEHGYVDAELELGERYTLGTGVAVDLQEGFRWYRAAANAGNASAQAQVGYAYAEGKIVTQDYKEAERWVRMACEHGVNGACFTLGTVYAEGRWGLPRNINTARIWMQKASADNPGPVGAMARDWLAKNR